MRLLLSFLLPRTQARDRESEEEGGSYKTFPVPYTDIQDTDKQDFTKKKRRNIP